VSRTFTPESGSVSPDHVRYPVRFLSVASSSEPRLCHLPRPPDENGRNRREQLKTINCLGP